MEIRGPVLLPARREEIELRTDDGLTLVGELAQAVVDVRLEPRDVRGPGAGLVDELPGGHGAVVTGGPRRRGPATRSCRPR